MNSLARCFPPPMIGCEDPNINCMQHNEWSAVVRERELDRVEDRLERVLNQ